MTVEVITAAAWRDRRRFVNLGWRLYRDDPHWVPPLKAALRLLLTSEKHPFYDQHRAATNELYLALDGGQVVGRVAAIRNLVHEQVHGESVVFFGFFESVNDPQVAAALLEAVESWARKQGATAVRGPMNPSTNYECGLLVRGFNADPVLMMTYNPDYYPQLIEAAGYTKIKDLYAYYSEVHDHQLDRLQRVAERARRRFPQLQTRSINLEEFARETQLLQRIYNAAWEDNWGYLPMSDAEFQHLARDLKPLVHPDLLRIAELDGEAVGFLLAVPDWNCVLKQLDGSPLRHPLRTLKHALMTKASSLPGLRLITLGICQEHRKKGFEAVLFAEAIQHAVKTGYQWAEYSWILEDNELTKRAVRLMSGKLYKIYRVYQKALS